MGTLEKERLFDQNAETALITAAITDQESREQICSDLTPSMFFGGVSSVIYSAIHGLWQKGSDVDALTVSNEIKASRSAGDTDDWFTMIVNLIADGVYPQSLKATIGIVRDMAERRELIGVLSNHASNTYAIGKPLDDIKASLVATLLDEKKESDDIAGMPATMKAVFSAIEAAASGAKIHLSTGFTALDKQLIGLLKHEFVVVGARPGMGKTSLMISWAVNLASAGVPVGFASLEQSQQELAVKMVAMRTGFQIGEVMHGKRYEAGKWRDFTEDEFDSIVKALGELENLPIHFLFASTVEQLAAITRKAKRKHGIQALFVDYIQLMETNKGSDNRTAELSNVTRMLKQTAMQLELPVVAGSQINRTVEGRDDKRPMLSDLRESGSIEQDADLVILLYRDEEYNANTEAKGIAELHIQKNRRGPTGLVELFFDKHTTRFSDIIKQRVEL